MSRQAWKEAVAAARDLLKVDAARVRKAGAAVSTRKAPPARVPEQRSSGCDAATAARSFTDGSYFNGSAMTSPDIAPNHGIINLQILQCGEQMQHLLDALPISCSLSCPKISFLVENLLTKDNNKYVNADSGEEAPRTQDEDVRMMSSWLINSTDSTCGADRKNEQYWADVEVTYNETTPSHRARNAKKIKDRFHKVNKWTDLFHSAWLKARMIYTSGYNDQMWIEKAHIFYLEDNKNLNLGPFVLMEVWNTVKTEAKWVTYNSGLKSARKRTATKGSDNEKEGEAGAHIDLDEVEDQPIPMGQK
ncbi:hypothetical protein EJB05_00008, partial [Eragrostis curvula]